MKTRIDFVSNSSSASFIVITDSGKESRPGRQDELVLPNAEFGETEFGWQTDKYNDFWSKLNWCAIILRSKREQEKYDTSDETLKECVKNPWFRSSEMEKTFMKVCSDAGMNVSVAWCRRDDDPDDYSYDGYIDHQSNVGEMPENARMFRSEKTLRDFLFNDGSYIDCSNDNGGRDDDDYDFNTGRYSSQPEDYYKVKPKVG